MKYALIAQPDGGDHLVNQYKLVYHLVLAQYVLSDSTYAAFYRAMRQQDHFIMLDNGAAENGHSIGIENVVKAADAIGGVDEIVMPDVLDECNATISATANAMKFVPERMRAVVPQGKDWDDWEYCATHLVAMHCRTICVAKRYEALEGGRAHALEIIKHHKWHLTHDVHLLGCYRNPLREILSAIEAAPWVRGIDTSAPISYAQHGDTLDHPSWHSLEWNKKFYFVAAEINMDLILEACRCT
jgi:hypothetical protein